MKYTIKSGDSFYNIANRFRISLFSLRASNPQIVNPTQLRLGQVIDVPVPVNNIVRTNIPYTYEVFTRDMNLLKQNYPFLRIESIGKSVLGKDIYAISFGSGRNEVTYNGAHHSIEWITTPVLMKFIQDFAFSLTAGIQLYGFNPQYIFSSSTIRIVPMVNPDGVNLAIKGLTEENRQYHNDLIRWNNGSRDFSRWSANIRGVDLNHNYDAAWNLSKEQEARYGIDGPGPTRYSGPAPESEPETQAMVRFTRNHRFRLVIAYHSQGEVIYWDFMNKAPAESLPIARRFGAISGYEIAGIAPGAASVGGYKDWFIDKFNRPGYTVEVGRGTNPLPLSQFNEIYLKNVGILLLAPLV